MKKTSLLLWGGLLGTIIGYTMGYLRIPLVAADQAFWVGLTAGAAGILLLISWKSFRSQGASGSHQKKSKGVLFVLSAAVLAILIFQAQLSHRSSQLESQQLATLRTEALQEASRQQENGRMISSTLQAITRRLDEGEAYSSNDIQDLKRASERCLPYLYVTEDSLSSHKLSPERAQLLVGILALRLADSLLVKTFKEVSFAFADLSGITLSGENLTGIDLRNSSLERANLDKCILIDADFREANLTHAMLNGADLTKADARRADMSWASLNFATIREGNFDGIIGHQMLLNDAAGTKARFQYADLSGAFIERSDMSMIDGELTNFSGSSFAQTTLHGSNLCRSILTEANLNQTIVDSCSVETEEWLTDLDSWQVVGGAEIRNQHVIVADTQKRYARSRLMLIRKEHLP